MKYIFSFFIWALIGIIAAPCSQAQSAKVNSAHPDTAFDFWLGSWEGTWDEGDGKQGRAINRIEKTLDGTVIQEHFQILEGQNKGFKGTSISVYQPDEDQWKQAWADNNGDYFDFTGILNGEQRIFQTAVRENQQGEAVIQRMVFYDIKENSMTWDWERSTDGGKSWTLNWRISYKRLEQN